MKQAAILYAPRMDHEFVAQTGTTYQIVRVIADRKMIQLMDTLVAPAQGRKSAILAGMVKTAPYFVCLRPVDITTVARLALEFATRIGADLIATDFANQAMIR